VTRRVSEAANSSAMTKSRVRFHWLLGFYSINSCRVSLHQMLEKRLLRCVTTLFSLAAGKKNNHRDGGDDRSLRSPSTPLCRPCDSTPYSGALWPLELRELLEVVKRHKLVPPLKWRCVITSCRPENQPPAAYVLRKLSLQANTSTHSAGQYRATNA